MDVECVFFGPLREAVGEKTVLLAPEPATVAGLVADLERTYAGLDGRLRDGDGLADEVVLTVNGRHAQHVDGFDTALSDGDVVRLTTAIYGG